MEKKSVYEIINNNEEVKRHIKTVCNLVICASTTDDKEAREALFGRPENNVIIEAMCLIRFLIDTLKIAEP